MKPEEKKRLESVITCIAYFLNEEKIRIFEHNLHEVFLYIKTELEKRGDNLLSSLEFCGTIMKKDKKLYDAVETRASVKVYLKSRFLAQVFNEWKYFIYLYYNEITGEYPLEGCTEVDKAYLYLNAHPEIKKMFKNVEEIIPTIPRELRE